VRWSRALIAWLAIVVAESIHGALRQAFLAPVIGDFPARQVGVPIGCAIILAIACATVRWIGARTLRDQLAVGLAWLVLIAGFEVGLGLALGLSRERILSDYDLPHGGFMGLGLAFLLVSPVLAARLRGVR
jgi:hypothetical protein